MGGHAGNTRDFTKGPLPQPYIDISYNELTMVVLPRDIVPSETIIWDMEHMVDVENFNANADRQQTAIQEVLNELEIQI